MAILEADQIFKEHEKEKKNRADKERREIQDAHIQQMVIIPKCLCVVFHNTYAAQNFVLGFCLPRNLFCGVRTYMYAYTHTHIYSRLTSYTHTDLYWLACFST